MQGSSTLFGQNKQAEIIRAVVGDIVRKELLPGHKLPSQKELCQQFDTTPVTVSRAIQQLIRIGLTRSRERQGVFVCDQLPRFPTYGLVFPCNPANPAKWNRFFRALNDASLSLDSKLECEFNIYYDIDGRLEMPSYRRLIADVSEYRVMGLVFAASPWPLAHIPLVQDTSFPRVAFMPDYQFPGIPAISTDGRSFTMKALDHLEKKGRQRIALIASGEMGELYLEAFRTAVEARGMRTAPYWMHAPSITHPNAAASIAHLLFHAASPEERPDGLVIADDNFTAPAERGVVQAGISVPEELSIVTHCNFPTAHSLLPLHRIGYDAAMFLRLGIERLEGMLRGEDVPKLFGVPPEDEATLFRKKMER